MIFVIDGSPEDSERIIADWIVAYDVDAKIISKPNGGLSSARNDGMDAATGVWISFPDPDDILAPDYLDHIAAAIDSDETQSVARFAGRVLQFVHDPAESSTLMPT